MADHASFSMNNAVAFNLPCAFLTTAGIGFTGAEAHVRARKSAFNNKVGRLTGSLLYFQWD